MMQDASGLIHVERNLFLVAEDNSDLIRFFELNTDDQGNPCFQSTGQNLNPGDGAASNSDFESLARIGDLFFVIGSYNAPERRKLLRFQMNGTALTAPPETISFDLAAIFLQEEIDIESLCAFRQDTLMVGFRKPLLQGKAPAIFFNTDTLETDIRYFDLRQRAFRDCVRIADDSFLILAGPEKGNKPRRRIYLWNGTFDDVRPQKCMIGLGNLRGEGICVRQGQGLGLDSLEILIGTDESSGSGGDFKMGYVKVNNVKELLENEIRLIDVRVTV
ncbi:MAG: hypothetical protein KKD01_17310 [Proteobacteria bacterium]|nr:hypothetical protein [Pseudomonadota bacterium]MBU1456485.1 hypothetical protein [Pseudomonadota bacterium]